MYPSADMNDSRTSRTAVGALLFLFFQALYGLTSSGNVFRVPDEFEVYFQVEHLVDAGDISVPQTMAITQPVVKDGQAVGQAAGVLRNHWPRSKTVRTVWSARRVPGAAASSDWARSRSAGQCAANAAARRAGLAIRGRRFHDAGDRDRRGSGGDRISSRGSRRRCRSA